MTQDELVKRAKELAALKAFEAYAVELERLLREAGLPITVLSETTHIHSAILLGGGEALSVRCRWDFTSKAEALVAALQKAKNVGEG
jgi:hypothetical protein